MVSFMHTSGSPTRHPTGHVPFSFADDLLDRTQPVCVTLGGFEYPGEVIVAGRWRAEFGRPLSGVSMFRLVLLHSTDVPAPDDIVDDRICVAAPGRYSIHHHRACGEQKYSVKIAGTRCLVLSRHQ